MPEVPVRFAKGLAIQAGFPTGPVFGVPCPVIPLLPAGPLITSPAGVVAPGTNEVAPPGVVPGAAAPLCIANICSAVMLGLAFLIPANSRFSRPTIRLYCRRSANSARLRCAILLSAPVMPLSLLLPPPCTCGSGPAPPGRGFLPVPGRGFLPCAIAHLPFLSCIDHLH